MINFTDLKSTTKKARGFIDSYNRALKNTDNYDIFTFYGKPSYNKIRAWNYWKNICYCENEDINGAGLVITGGNSSFFSIGFIYADDLHKYLVYVTASNNYRIVID